MGYKDTLSTLVADAQADAAKMQEKVTALESIGTDVEADLKAKDDASAQAVAKAHEDGFEEGLKQAGQAGGSDKLYSDAELNESIKIAVDNAVAPLNSKIDAMTADAATKDAKVADLQDKLDKAADEKTTAIESAKSDLKAQFVADIKAVDVDNQAMLVKYEEK